MGAESWIMNLDKVESSGSRKVAAWRNSKAALQISS
jgi:hypothetical protein